MNLSDVLGKMHEQFLKAPCLCELPCSLHWAVGAHLSSSKAVFTKGDRTVSLESHGKKSG